MKKEINEEEIARIRRYARRIKHRILIELIYECRLSVDEALSLKYSDIDLINGEIMINRTRIIMPLRLVNLLRYHFSCEKNTKYILETHHGKMNRNAAELIIKTIALQAVNKPVSSEDIRQTSFNRIFDTQHNLLFESKFEDYPSLHFSKMDNLLYVRN